MEFHRAPFRAAPLPESELANFALDSLNNSILNQNAVVDPNQFADDQLFSVGVFQ